MFTDLRHACRALLRARGFTVVTVLTLALGIGAAASIFSVVDWVLFRSRSFPNDVFMLGGATPDESFRSYRYPYQTDIWTQQNQLFATTALATRKVGNIAVAGQPVASNWVAASPTLLPMLEIQPALGRQFRDDEAVPGADQVAIVSHAFWRDYLGANPDVLGSLVTVGDDICTVIGVLRSGQFLPSQFNTGLFRPYAEQPNPDQPWTPTHNVLTRLQPGVSPRDAEQTLAALEVPVPAVMASFMGNDRPHLVSLAEANQYSRPEIYWLMLGAAGALYAIACLNASNLTLVRMLGQRRDLSIRLALGSDRWRIIRLLAFESVGLAFVAAIGGIMLANWLMPFLFHVTGAWSGEFQLRAWSLDQRVLAVLGCLSVGTALVITVIPTLRVLRTPVYLGLKDGGAALGESRGLARLRGFFVVLQAGLAVVLLMGAGLMIRTFQKFDQVDLGFNPAGRSMLQLNLPSDFPTDPEARVAALREISDQIRRMPGVRDVGLGSNNLLLSFYNSFISNLRGPDGESIRVPMSGFLPGSPEVIGLTLKRGRWLDQTSGNEVMVNEAFARKFWPDGSDPVGQFVLPQSRSQAANESEIGWQVIGVVGDIRSNPREPAEPKIFAPSSRTARVWDTFYLLTDSAASASLGNLRNLLYAANPRIVVVQLQSFDELNNQLLWAERLTYGVLRLLATIALLLTVVGIFSVVAYTVDRRMNEFGVRLALGATPGHLVDLVLRRGVMLTGMGIVLGLGASLALGRFMQSLLFETPTHDPWVLGGVAIVLLLTALVASLLPARRAARVDITRLLRAE